MRRSSVFALFGLMLLSPVRAAPWAPVPAGEHVGSHTAPVVLRGAGTAHDAARRPAVASEPPSFVWTRVALAGIEKYRLNPLRAARLLAHLHVALRDALDACASQPDAAACGGVAQHAAAGRTLEFMLPEETAGRFQAMGVAAWARLAADGAHPDPAPYVQQGERAAWGVMLRAASDGADRALAAPPRPPPRPGTWRPTPPLYAVTPSEQGATRWRLWLLRSPSEIEPPPPPAYGSPRYVADVREVLDVGRALTERQKRIADDWNLDQGTATPAGVWNRHALRLIERHHPSPAEATRLLATLNVAMADAFVACWHAKLRWWSERPVLEVRERFDAAFEPHIVTPPFPGYVSGHSTVSGAAAAVLAAALPAASAQLLHLAEEAALSRLYGGIHFRHDNEAGLQLGLEIGRLAVQRAGLTPLQSTYR